MINFPNPKCGKCAHYKSGNCLIHNSSLPNEYVCANYTESAIQCESCGKHLLNEQTIITTGAETPYHVLCPNCFQAIGTCNSCSFTSQCAFETDNTIPEPKYVMQRIQQGPTIMQTQVKNPKRINLTCKVNCPCFQEGECVRNDGSSCDKYKCAVENW